MSSLELKIPPPFVALVAAALMWLVSAASGTPEVQVTYRIGAALALALAGTSIRLAGQFAFWRANTTVNPVRPGLASSVVHSGVYRYTRNPMYLGRAIQLSGWGVYLASPWALLLVPLYVAYIDRYQVAAEERALLARFGPEYEVYQSKVPRWL